MRFLSKFHFPTSLRRLSIVTTVAAVSALTIAAAPAPVKSSQDVDIALEWWDISNIMLVPPAGPVGIENVRAWTITWLAAARAVNLDPSPGPAQRYREAAFAGAIHESLVTFVPSRSAELDQALAVTLSRIPDGPAETNGVAAGRATARGVLAERVGDGLDNASVQPPYTPPPAAPGVWRPTPPDFPPAIWPGLPNARPFVLNSADQFRPGPPSALGSDQYRADWTEVRDYGASNSTVRTAEQTQVATFMQTAPPPFFHPAVRAALQELTGSLKKQAELVATVRLAIIDGAITIFDAKYHYVYWRPITAIREADTDGDPLTSPDPTWTPLQPTAPHPEYLSGHAGQMGAIVEVLTAFTGAGPNAPFTFTNPNMPGVTRTYESWGQLEQEMINARVWVGFHFRTTNVVSAEVTSQVAQYIIGKSDELFS
jgi:hypothetical protein